MFEVLFEFALKHVQEDILVLGNTDSEKRELSEFFFYSMDVFQHQLNDINRFIGVPANKELSCCFQSRRNVDIVKIFVIILPFFFLVFFSCFVSNEDSEIIECQICINFLF